MVEHATENRGVPSSTLGLGTTPSIGRRLLLPTLFVAVVLLGGSALACSRDRTRTFVVEQTLAPGGELTVRGTNVSGRFVGVVSDSRCPVDASCVQAGEATVLLEVTVKGRSSELRITVPRDGSGEARHEGVIATVLEVRPLPRAGQPIPAQDYRAVVRLERR